jgi:cyanophycinase
MEDRIMRACSAQTLPWMGLLLWAPAAAAQQPPPLSVPAPLAGALVIAGGGGIPDTVRDCFLALAGGKQARLVVIPTADIKADEPDELKSWAYWKAQDVASVELVHTRRRDEANRAAFARRLAAATAVWLVGGDQSRLIESYKDTAVERELHQLLARGGVIGGSSAGAAVMGPLMIRRGETLAEVGAGLGFFPGVVVDQHFLKRNREPRLHGVVARYPRYLGLGVDEQTAVVVKGRSLAVVGNSEVRVCASAASGAASTVLVLQPGARVDFSAIWQAASSGTPPATAAER